MKRLSFILVALLMLSCAKQVPEKGGYGTLSLAVKVPELQGTKAALSPEALLAGARVNIYYADFSGLVFYYLHQYIYIMFLFYLKNNYLPNLLSI